MTRLNCSRTLSLLCTLGLLGIGTAGLAGCSIGAASFPDASVNPTQTPLGSISGSDFGGHAPLIGAHVYVLQPSVTTATATAQNNAEYNAYGAQASSLLTSSYTAGSGYPTTANTSDPGIPAGWYYETTDLTGAFNISGDYSCTAGVPVYLYLYGGSPTYPSANNVFNISSVTVSGSASPYTVTFTINTSSAQPIENAYIGEEFTITGLTGGAAFLNNSAQLVTSTSLTTTTFSSTVGSLGTTGSTGTFSQTGTNQVTFLPSFNPGVVNLAVLGNCPNNGTLAGTGAFSGASAIKYVFVNEVSTAAAAYAFRPFTFTPSTSNQIAGAAAQTSCSTPYAATSGSSTTTQYYWNNATCIGTSSNNLVGLQNAANLAAQLYDITGSQITTSYAGEGHIANKLTTNLNGIVPQAMIDTLGNILAACVDSNNGSTIVGSTGTINPVTGVYPAISAQCNTLFTYATGNAVAIGSTGAGVQPYDTATAALNIARHPGGPPSTAASTAANFMSNLYSLPQGNRPFQPDIASTAATQPNDFSIGIYYPQSLNGSYENVAESVAIDKIGNAWVTAQNGTSPAYFYEMSPTGVRSNIQSSGTYFYGYTAIDTNQNAWAGAAQSTNPVTYVQKSGTTTSSTTYPNPYTYNAGAQNSTLVEDYTYGAFADAAGNVYFANNKTAGSTVDYIQTLSGAASNPATTSVTESAAIPTFATASGGITHAAMQPTGGTTPSAPSAYIDYNNTAATGTAYVSSVVLSSGANNSGFPVVGVSNVGATSTSGCSSMLDPEALAVTQNGDAIVPDYHNGTGTINTATSSLYFITATGTCTQISGASYTVGLNSPFGAVIDGNDFAYITDRGNNNGTTISILDMRSATSTLTNVSPSTGIQPSYVNSSNALTPELLGPLNIAAGPSGELWITNPAGNSLVEIIGLAFPTVTPLAAGTFTTTGYGGGTVGTRP